MGPEPAVVDDALSPTSAAYEPYGYKSFSADGRLVAVVEFDVVHVVDFDSGRSVAVLTGSSADFRPE
jgi:hypothetical protein